MTTDELVATLTRQLAPVRPLPAPRTRLLAWMAMAVPAIAATLFVLRPRPDLIVRLVQPDFAWPLAAASLAGVWAARTALTLAIPGAESRGLRRATWLMLFSWGAALGIVWWSAGPAIEPGTHWMACSTRLMAAGAVPAAALWLMIRRAAPLEPRAAGLFAVLAAMSFAAMAVQAACPLDGPGHALAGHFAPVIALGSLGAAAAHRWLNRA